MAETATNSTASAAVTVAVTQPEHTTVNVVASAPDKKPEVGSTAKEQPATTAAAVASATDVKLPATNQDVSKTSKPDAAANPSPMTGGSATRV